MSISRNFVHTALPGRVIFGPGTQRVVAEELSRLGCSRGFVLSGPNGAAGARALQDQLGAQATGVFTSAAMHTPVEITERALRDVRVHGADALIALGGGSTIGLAKAIALRTDLPQIVIPTTYAGSEMTPILGETAGDRKTTVRDPKVLPEVIIYDVELTYSLSQALSVTSGMNAIAHAVEALYAKDGSPIVSIIATEAIRVMARALPAIVVNSRDETARSDALYAAWLCGFVLASVGMALHHKLCHVLGGSFNMPHAQTHTVLLPHTTAFNAPAVPDKLAPVAELLGSPGPGQGLYSLAQRIGAPSSLKELGFPEDALDRAADIAMEQPYWNPRALSREGIRGLLDDAWHGRRPAS